MTVKPLFKIEIPIALSIKTWHMVVDLPPTNNFITVALKVLWYRWDIFELLMPLNTV